jgi:hypothetical protein
MKSFTDSLQILPSRAFPSAIASIATDPFRTPDSEVGWSEKRAEWAFCTFGSYVLQ